MDRWRLTSVSDGPEPRLTGRCICGLENPTDAAFAIENDVVISISPNAAVLVHRSESGIGHLKE